MSVMDASVYIALVNAHEQEHTTSWGRFKRAKQVPVSYSGTDSVTVWIVQRLQ